MTMRTGTTTMAATIQLRMSRGRRITPTTARAIAVTAVRSAIRRTASGPYLTVWDSSQLPEKSRRMPAVPRTMEVMEHPTADTGQTQVPRGGILLVTGRDRPTW